MNRVFEKKALRLGGLAAALVTIIMAGIASGAASPEAAVPPVDETQAIKITLTPPSSLQAPSVPGEIAPDATSAVALSRLLAENRCLAEVMYFEARGEGEEGEKAVAEVILNRLSEGSHGSTICGVVYEGAHQTFCQFTFVCDGSLAQSRSPEAWREAQVLAARILSGETSVRGEAGGATYYHTLAVHPTWAPKKQRIAQIGNHIFYRDPQNVSGLPGMAFRGSLQ